MERWWMESTAIADDDAWKLVLDAGTDDGHSERLRRMDLRRPRISSGIDWDQGWSWREKS